MGALTFAGTPGAWAGQLDLHNSALVVQTAGTVDKEARIPNLLSQIASAKAGGGGGPWTGPGITSSAIPTTPNTALALADNADLNFTSFRGQPADANSLLLTMARLGDATLDNKVDAFDLNKLAANWQAPGSALWSDGDFTGDGKVDAFDLNLLAANWQFGAAGSFEAARLAASWGTGFPPIDAVPEPASLVMLVPLLLICVRRKA